MRREGVDYITADLRESWETFIVKLGEANVPKGLHRDMKVLVDSIRSRYEGRIPQKLFVMA